MGLPLFLKFKHVCVHFYNTNGSLRITQASFPLTVGVSALAGPTIVFRMMHPNSHVECVVRDDDDGPLLNCPWFNFCAHCPIIIKLNLFCLNFSVKKTINSKHNIKVIFCCNYTKRSIFFRRVFNVCPTTMLLLFFFCFLWNTITFCSLFLGRLLNDTENLVFLILNLFCLLTFERIYYAFVFIKYYLLSVLLADQHQRFTQLSINY